MSTDQNKSASRFGPVKFAADTVSTVRRVAVTATAGDFALPAGWPGQWITMRAVGADVYFFFADSAAETVDSTKVAESHAQLGYPVLAGEEKDYLVPKGASHLSWDATAAGQLYLHLSSGVKKGDG